MPGERSRQPSFAMLLGVAWLLLVAQLLAQYGAATASTFPDTDDAMRLVEMRNFLAGSGWFDLRDPRVGLPPFYESHWSRLIDAGLAGLLLLFRVFVDMATAERLMMTVWPLLWLLPCVGAVAAMAWRLAGREAAVIVLLLAVFNIPGLSQFRPGRVDHHNVQIALALLAAAATLWSDRVRWAAFAAGATTGAALAIGLEALPIHAACGIALALRYVMTPDGAKPLRAYGLALAGATLLAFLVTAGPGHWTRSVCDALAVNLAGAVVVAGLGVAAIARPDLGGPLRCIGTIGVGVVAAAVYGVAEPQCLRGPMAEMDPAVWPIWASHIREAQSLWTVLLTTPQSAIKAAAFPVFGLVAVLIGVCDAQCRRDFAFWSAVALFLVGCATMFAAIRASSYAVWLGLPLVACAAMRLFVSFGLRSLLARVFAAMMLTPTVVTGLAVLLGSVAGVKATSDANDAIAEACTQRNNVAPLAALTPGLIAANEPDWGPYLLVWTPHRVVTAPYHRLSAALLESHRIFTVPPEEARVRLLRIQADYVVTCGMAPPSGVSAETLRNSLWARLHGDTLPDWLQPLKLDTSNTYSVYRIVP